MKDNIAFCGLDCERCEARMATINDDDALRRKVAEEWSRLNGIEILPEMINCVGCRAEGVKTVYCQSLCPIRQCGLSRGYRTCGECGELETCDKVSKVIMNNRDALDNLRKNRSLADGGLTGRAPASSRPGRTGALAM